MVGQIHHSHLFSLLVLAVVIAVLSKAALAIEHSTGLQARADESHEYSLANPTYVAGSDSALESLSTVPDSSVTQDNAVVDTPRKIDKRIRRKKFSTGPSFMPPWMMNFNTKGEACVRYMYGNMGDNDHVPESGWTHENIHQAGWTTMQTVSDLNSLNNLISAHNKIINGEPQARCQFAAPMEVYLNHVLGGVDPMAAGGAQQASTFPQLPGNPNANMPNNRVTYMQQSNNAGHAQRAETFLTDTQRGILWSWGEWRPPTVPPLASVTHGAQWPDVAHAAFEDACNHAGTRMTDIKHIAFVKIADPLTRAVVYWIMSNWYSSRRTDMNNLRSSDLLQPVTDPITVLNDLHPETRRCASALMGTPVGKRVAKFMAEHRHLYGRKQLISITVFADGTCTLNGATECQPTLIFNFRTIAEGRDILMSFADLPQDIDQYTIDPGNPFWALAHDQAVTALSWHEYQVAQRDGRLCAGGQPPP